MNNHLPKKIIVLECAGFALIVTMLWLNEILDLPRLLFGAPETPINWRESLVESLVVIALAGLVTSVTRLTLARIKYLEGFILVCAACKRVCIRHEWIAFDVFLRDHSDAKVSHGLCPLCAADLRREIPSSAA
ncbi:MAG: hypothetical protein BWY59_02181 [Verrucomicrobia bacterium ADurb.Bin345]|nr:MAG: hypothetical protein BWY59_02181 [Verrucomicrobia bacterium ADurb.Bin345]